MFLTFNKEADLLRYTSFLGNCKVAPRWSMNCILSLTTWYLLSEMLHTCVLLVQVLTIWNKYPHGNVEKLCVKCNCKGYIKSTICGRRKDWICFGIDEYVCTVSTWLTQLKIYILFSPHFHSRERARIVTTFSRLFLLKAEIKMCVFHDQTKDRICLWRWNTFCQQLQIVLWYLCLSNYHFAWGTETSITLSSSLAAKHILFIESSRRGTDHSVPFVDIKQGFDIVQHTPFFINQNDKNTRNRHLFLVTSDTEATKEDLRQAFLDKIEQRAVKERNTHDFIVYKILLKELRSHGVDAFDLDIKFDNKNYTIKNCKQSDSGTFNLGAKVNWSTRRFEINHVEKVTLQNSKSCKDFSLQNPPGTCRT